MQSDTPQSPSGLHQIEGISAVTLATRDMSRSLRFYCALGFAVRYGSERDSFASLLAGSGYLNLAVQPAEQQWPWWGRVIFYVTNVDKFYEQAVRNGLIPDTSPADASWGERFFHITDPEGHELSFARPIETP